MDNKFDINYNPEADERNQRLTEIQDAQKDLYTQRKNAKSIFDFKDLNKKRKAVEAQQDALADLQAGRTPETPTE